MSSYDPAEVAEERDCDNANCMSRIEDLLIEIRDLLKDKFSGKHVSNY